MPVINCTPITSPEQWHGLRAPNVGASEVSALLGVNPFLSAYTLAGIKMGKVSRQEDNPSMQRGRLLEPVAMQLLKQLRPDWQQVPAQAYYSDDQLRFGCTPDLFVRTTYGMGNIQIKTVTPWDFKTRWHNDAGETEPPLWIAIQAMSEQHLTGCDWSYVAALVIGHGIDLELIQVHYQPEVIESIRQKVADFWRLVDAGEMPDPDYGRDRHALADILRQDDGTEIDLRSDNELPEIVAQLEALKMAKSTAQEGIDEAQAKILHRMGTAQRALFAGGVITYKTVHRKSYTVQAGDYRKLTVKASKDQGR